MHSLVAPRLASILRLDMPAADSLSTSRISATKRANPAGRGRDNHRNGSYPKTVLTEDGTVDLDVPRDRNGTFDPQIVPKGENSARRFRRQHHLNDARGMTVREIQGHLRELYAVDVSPDLISRVTDAVLDEVREWQNRPLDAIYPVIFFDALRVKIHDEGVVRTRQQPSGLTSSVSLAPSPTRRRSADLWPPLADDTYRSNLRDRNNPNRRLRGRRKPFVEVCCRRPFPISARRRNTVQANTGTGAAF